MVHIHVVSQPEFLTFYIYASRCCTDLGDNDLELTIVQGISYNVANPKDVDTYVKYEFPYPSVSKRLYLGFTESHEKIIAH